MRPFRLQGQALPVPIKTELVQGFRSHFHLRNMGIISYPITYLPTESWIHWRAEFGELLVLQLPHSSCQMSVSKTCTVLVLRMAHRKWKETKQLPGTAGSGNMLGCCLIYFHFLWVILSTGTVLCVLCATQLKKAEFSKLRPPMTPRLCTRIFVTIKKSTLTNLVSFFPFFFLSFFPSVFSVRHFAPADSLSLSLSLCAHLEKF